MLTRASFPGRSLDPIPWTTYFERELFLPAPDGSITYHAYLTSPAPSSGPGKPPGPLFVTHHGAGSSGLSFAVLSAEIRKRLPSAGILSLDARGHGLTTTARGEEDAPAAAEDLTLATLASDLLAILRLTRLAMHWPALPPLLLVGHSLGGAVVTEFASVLLSSLSSQPPAPTPAPPPTTTPMSIATGATKATLPQRSPPAAGNDPGLSSTQPPPPASPEDQPKIDLLGYAVLDVVEGSALDALQSMHAYLATRPAGFETLRDGVEWHVRSRTVRNAVSARASVPGLLVCAQSPESDSEGGAGGAGVGGGGGQLEEEGQEAVEGKEKGGKPWRWRTDLARTQPFWEGWFGGLSGKFLRGRGGKMLLLAGTDRLDTELTIGQMQGWFFSSSSVFLLFLSLCCLVRVIN